MVDPAGKQFVYLSKPDDVAGSAVAVTVGAQLDGGYQIESIEDKRIGLVYPALDTHLVIDIPPAPELTPQ